MVRLTPITMVLLSVSILSELSWAWGSHYDYPHHMHDDFPHRNRHDFPRHRHHRSHVDSSFFYPDYDRFDHQPVHPGYHDRERLSHSMCDPDDEYCHERMVSGFSAGGGGDREVPEKMKRDREYEEAIAKGEAQAKKELDERGGPDPYGGFLIPGIERLANPDVDPHGDDYDEPKRHKARANEWAEEPRKGEKKKGGKAGQAYPQESPAEEDTN